MDVCLVVHNGRPLMDKITAVKDTAFCLIYHGHDLAEQAFFDSFHNSLHTSASPHTLVTIMPSNQTQQQIGEDERHLSTLLSIIPAAIAQNAVNILPFLS